jgi:crotonobetainyl-CoA:carnitine CoA-transferase CaiB-like acyl-CoA transferase
VAGADVILVGAAGRDDPYGAHASIDDWAARFPALVVTLVTPFGATGPRATWASSPLVQYAMSCWLHITGRPEREPVAVGGHLSDLVPGICAASASLMAVRARQASGLGQIVDVSEQEALLLCQPYLDVGFAYTGEDRRRNGAPFPMTIVPAADGYLGINVLTQTQWELLCAFSQRGDLMADPRFADPRRRGPHALELTEVFADWARDKERVETFRQAQQWRIPFGFVPRIAEVGTMDQHVDRSFFVGLQHPGEDTLVYPGVPFLINGRRIPVRRAPAIGEAGTAAPASPTGSSASAAPASPTGSSASAVSTSPDSRATGAEPSLAGPLRPASAGPSPTGGPMAGVRCVDLSMFWSGPLTAGLLAQYGAEVIKVESVQRVDGWRGMAASAGIEESNIFNSVNLNKEGITLDLTSPEGRELLRPLVQSADVLIENFSSRVMGNFGLTDEVLFEWNPRLVILSMSAFGWTGPWRDFVGFAPTIEQLSGLPELTGYAGGPPMLTGNSVADPIAGLMGCFALLAVLHRRDNGSGGGTHIDLSQLEALTSLLAPELIEEQRSATPGQRQGNASEVFAPYGCYPCRDPDTWIVITVTDERSWAALSAEAGWQWTDDPRFDDPAARRRHAALLDDLLTEWTRQHDNVRLADQLQQAGVAAAPVLTPSQLYQDSHLEARHSYQWLDRDHVGPKRYPVLPWKLARTPGAVRRPGPTLGQDNQSILGGRLGLSPTRLAELRARRVIGERIPAED